MDNTNNSISFIKRYKQKYVIYIQTQREYFFLRKRKEGDRKRKIIWTRCFPLSLSYEPDHFTRERVCTFVHYFFIYRIFRNAIPKIMISVILSCRVSTLQSIPSSPQILHFIARIFYVYPLKKKEKSPSVSCPKRETKFPAPSPAFLLESNSPGKSTIRR